VTHRGVSTAFLVVSAHDEAAFAAATAGIAANKITLIVLMGLGRSAAIAWRLIDACWSRRTPVAVITDATTARQQVWRGRLDDLAEDRVVDAKAAGTIVIGDVVALGLAQDVSQGFSPAVDVAQGSNHARDVAQGFSPAIRG
jgi:siroheme synthase